ncbi:hypothetical protein Ancab_016197 [Ancistrocladus abbreviatus]
MKTLPDTTIHQPGHRQSIDPAQASTDDEIGLLNRIWVQMDWVFNRNWVHSFGRIWSYVVNQSISQDTAKVSIQHKPVLLTRLVC